jgi:hypothetical protein
MAMQGVDFDLEQSKNPTLTKQRGPACTLGETIKAMLRRRLGSSYTIVIISSQALPRKVYMNVDSVYLGRRDIITLISNESRNGLCGYQYARSINPTHKRQRSQTQTSSKKRAKKYASLRRNAVEPFPSTMKESRN